MPIGAWQTPFPRQIGGEGEVRGSEMFRLLRENFGDAWAQTAEAGNVAVNVAEDIAAARLLLMADRFLDRWRNQADPLTMDHEFVERWEAILGIRPTSAQTWNDRRRTIKARGTYELSETRGGVAAICEQAFAPWTTHVHFIPKASAVMFWPGDGSSTTDLFWYSTTANLCIEYVVPATATQAEIDARLEACFAALDAFCAAWVTFTFSQTQSYGTNADTWGWFLDQPNLDVACFGS